ncbi:MAG: EscN/YscN/HrcN family type III secretion system ATPase, partial [Myxococcaceae bacterium]|nr:EscN/YscN/HrcN family type III secretion system ATPase [Myxococcaceae bacterium]
MAIDLRRYHELLKTAQTVRVRGRVTELTGLVIKAAVPNVRVGEVCIIKRGRESVRAEVVGFQGEQVMLMPLGELSGIGPDSEVIPTGRPLTIRAGEGLLGRVLNGLGEPIDGKPLPTDSMQDWAVDRDCPDPFKRMRITRPLPLGVRCIDGLLTVGEGQRIGLFAGSGVGKSTLMGQIARNTAAELSVIALIGERGREVLEFIEDALGHEGMKRSVVVCATSDQPSLVRLRAGYVAT